MSENYWIEVVREELVELVDLSSIVQATKYEGGALILWFPSGRSFSIGAGTFCEKAWEDFRRYRGMPVKEKK